VVAISGHDCPSTMTTTYTMPNHDLEMWVHTDNVDNSLEFFLHRRYFFVPTKIRGVLVCTNPLFSIEILLGKDRLGSVIRYPCYGDYR
jgi:hypothetical protein